MEFLGLRPRSKGILVLDPKFNFALKTNTTFSKATVDVLGVIGDLAMPPFSLLLLALLSQFKKVSRMLAWNIIHEGYSA